MQVWTVNELCTNKASCNILNFVAFKLKKSIKKWLMNEGGYQNHCFSPFISLQVVPIVLYLNFLQFLLSHDNLCTLEYSNKNADLQFWGREEERIPAIPPKNSSSPHISKDCLTMLISSTGVKFVLSRGIHHQLYCINSYIKLREFNASIY